MENWHPIKVDVKNIELEDVIAYLASDKPIMVEFKNGVSGILRIRRDHEFQDHDYVMEYRTGWCAGATEPICEVSTPTNTSGDDYLLRHIAGATLTIVEGVY